MSSNFANISLKMPEVRDYQTLYQTRFLPEVVYWADEIQQNPTLRDYAEPRLMAQSEGLLFERIILLDENPIGTISARRVLNEKESCFLGIVIATPGHWGKGYGQLALEHFLKLLPQQKITQVYLETFANNHRAQRCFEKFGFKKKRIFYSAPAGRYVLEMHLELEAPKAIGERIPKGDPRWLAPKEKKS